MCSPIVSPKSPPSPASTIVNALIASSSAVETTEQIVSPFSEESITPSDGKGLEFNVENVDKVLDEIRPYYSPIFKGYKNSSLFCWF